MTTLQELRGMNDTELQAELGKAQKKLMELKIKVKLGQLKETHEVKGLKKLIAQIHTVVTERLTEEANQA